MDITENDKFQMARMMLNHANAIVMHSGNIINWFTLKKGVNPKSSEELRESLTSTISAWMASIGNELVGIQEPLNLLEIQHKELMQSFENQPRGSIKITAKLFLSHWRSTVVKESVRTVCTSLGISKLDTLIVSFPVISFGGFEEGDDTVQTNADLQRIKPIWKEMEVLVKDGVIDHIGVTDLDAISLEELHSWASGDWLMFLCNLEIISEKSLQGVLDAVPGADSNEWSPSYAIRYSVVVKCRGIVEAKGYTVGAQRRSDDGVKDSGFF